MGDESIWNDAGFGPQPLPSNGDGTGDGYWVATAIIGAAAILVICLSAYWR